MAWLILFVAGLFEVAWAVGLKYTDGFSRLWPSVGVAVALVCSMALLGLATKTLPIGTSYAVWTGIGTVGAAVLGMVLFNEPRDAIRVVSLALIVAGIFGLKFVSAH